MRRKINIISSLDWLTVIIYIILIILGWLNIYAATFNEEHPSIFTLSELYGTQLLIIIFTFITGFIVLLINSQFYYWSSYFIYAIVLFLLIAVLIFGKEVHGAKSWFSFGFVNFQPSEFAKLATGLALANYLTSFNLKIHKPKTLLIIFTLIFIPAWLIFLQNDTGSALVFFAFILPLYREGLSGIVLLIAFIAVVLFICALVLDKLVISIILISITYLLYLIINKNFKQFIVAILIAGLFGLSIWLMSNLSKIDLSAYYIILIALSLASIVYIIFAYLNKYRTIYILILSLYLSGGYVFSVNYAFNNILEEHQRKRINIVLGIESDPLGVGYNVNQSIIAIGSGGVSGKGFLQGTQTKFNFVPEQSTDFIFCTVGEEWGFIGSVVVLSLLLFLLLRLIKLAERQRSPFSRIYGYSIVSVLFFHIAVNIGMTIGLVPVIGIPLPFFSYGGSSLLAYSIMLFIFLKLDATRMALLK